MKLAIPPFIAALLLLPAVALACPYTAGAAGCHACGGGTSLAGYLTWLVVGVGLGFASVRRK